MSSVVRDPAGAQRCAAGRAFVERSRRVSTAGNAVGCNRRGALPVLLQAQYDAWGNVTSYSVKGMEQGTDLSAWPLPHGFAGGLLDVDTGLLRFGARDYDPSIGRWTAKDPILFNGGQANLWVYVGNDPVNFVDVEGRFKVGAEFAQSYPKATARIHSLQHRLTNVHYLAYNIYGQASDRTIRNAFGKGGGPRVIADATMYGATGQFDPSQPDRIFLDQSLLADYEFGTVSDSFLDRVLLHEMTHYFDAMDGRRYPGEAGNEFEKTCLGGVRTRR